jgi:hypothetical protein
MPQPAIASDEFEPLYTSVDRAVFETKIQGLSPELELK